VGGVGDGGKGHPVKIICIPFLFFLPYLFFCEGDSYPETCAQRTAEADRSTLLQLTGRGPGAGSLC
jgi:hypothetical protein